MNVRPFFQRLGLGAGVGLIATIAYRSTQYLTAERATIREECWTWHWLPFDTAWLWPYLSMFLLVGLPWFLLPDLRKVRRFAVCLLGVAAFGWISFGIYPTACARPESDGLSGYYAALLVLDRPNNCFPCLHSAFTALTVRALLHSGGIFRSATGKALLGLWMLAICMSIVALRQHTDIDMLAGLALGGVGGWLYGRMVRP